MKLQFNFKDGLFRHDQFRTLSLISMIAAVSLVGTALRAADVSWTGGGTGLSSDWRSGTNWSSSVVPGSSDNAVFNGGSATNNSLIDMVAAGGTQQVGSISLVSGQNANVIIGNSSTTTSGTLVLNGVGGVLLSDTAGTGGELIIENFNQPLSLGLAASGAIYASSSTGNPVASTDPGRVEIYSPIIDIGGSRSITLTGPGNVYLRGVNTYSGNTTIQNGALELDATGTVGDGSGTIYLSGGNIQSGASRNGYSSGNWIPNPIVLTADAHIFNSASTANSTRNIPFSGSLTGSGGSLIICNPTSVSGNSFVPRFSGAFTNSLPVVLGDTSGSAFADNTLDFSAIDLCNAVTNGVQVWNGTFSGPGNLRRSSPVLSYSTMPGGVAILTGSNTFSGGSSINDGTLFANNTTGSALGSGLVGVYSHGTLAGNGTILASVTNGFGGNIQPGSTATNVGTLTVNSLLFGPAGNYTWQISSATGTAGVAWDLINASNTGWTDNGNNTNKNVIHLKSIGSPTGWNKSTAYTWLIISNNPANSPGFNATNWSVDTTYFGGTAAGAFSVTTDANGSLDLVYTPLANTQPVAHMLILAPGESAALGSAPGKTGSPSAQHSTVGYTVIVKALDASYNLCSNSFDTVTLASSAAGDTLPAIAPLVNGSITFSLVNNTVGNITVTATNVTEGIAVPTGSSIVPVNINTSTTTLASSVNPAQPGVPISLSATVSSTAATRTGTVTFMKNGTNVMGTATLAGNSASITLSGGTGTNSITAIYSGDANSSSSTNSPALTQVINSSGGGVVQAGVAALMQDGQDYAAATSTPITGRGPWVCGGGTASSSFIKIIAGDLSGATSPDIRTLPNTVNPAAHLQLSKAGSNSRWYFRSMTNSVSSGSVYFSFLLNVSVNPTTTDEFMGTMISSTVTNTPAPTDPLSIHARAGADSTHFDLGVERLNGETAWTGDLADNTTYLVVLKYTFGSAAGCSIYVNPIPGGTEPTPNATAYSDGVTAEPANIGQVLFYEAGSVVTYLTSGTYNYDVMRVDNNWATVTPSVNGATLNAMSLAFSPASQSLPVKQNSALITVTLQQSNLTFNATANTVVNLSSTSGGGTFLSGANGTTVINSVTISNGTSMATFYYKDSNAGTPTITAASGLLTPATQSETVTNPPASSAPGFPPGSVTRLSSGNISLNVTGAVGVAWSLHATNSLTIPRPWPTIQSGTIGTSPFTINDLTATNYPNRFYYFSAP
jgi:fibronectin-binding autotransporter adhesin